MKTVAEMWEHFESFLNPEISDIQRTEMQRCFYAGAGEMLHAILRAVFPSWELISIRWPE